MTVDKRLAWPDLTMIHTRRPIVLSVDGNRVVHDIYASAFEPHYDHLCAHSGREALHILRRRLVDAMILEVVMPDISGLETLKRALKTKPRLTVVMTSAISTPRIARRVVRCGAADYFVKPVEPQALEGTVRLLLATRGSPELSLPKPLIVRGRVLIVGCDPGLVAVLSVALQRYCRIDVASRLTVAMEMIDLIEPDLIVVDLRGASDDRVLHLASLCVRVQRGSIIAIAPTEKAGPLLKPSVRSSQIVVPEPLDLAQLFGEIAALLPKTLSVIEFRPFGPVVTAALGRILTRFTEPALRVSDLSSGSELSTAHFSHVFSSEMRIPPMEYVVRVRVQVAILMLRETRDKVETIARHVGFYDGPHLAYTLRRRGVDRASEFRRLPEAA